MICQDCDVSFLFKNFETNEIIEMRNLTSTNLKFHHLFENDSCGIFQLNIMVNKEGFETNSTVLNYNGNIYKNNCFLKN